MDQLKFPVPVSEFQSFLPHRGPAVWVDEIRHVDAESGVCGVRYSSRATYAKGCSLLEAAYIEWMAQSFGYLCAAQFRLGLAKDEGEMKETFMAAVKNFEIHEVPREIQDGELFEIKMKATHRVGPVTLVEGLVERSGKILAKAQLKLFAIPR